MGLEPRAGLSTSLVVVECAQAFALRIAAARTPRHASLGPRFVIAVEWSAAAPRRLVCVSGLRLDGIAQRAGASGRVAFRRLGLSAVRFRVPIFLN